MPSDVELVPQPVVPFRRFRPWLVTLAAAALLVALAVIVPGWLPRMVSQPPPVTGTTGATLTVTLAVHSTTVTPVVSQGAPPVAVAPSVTWQAPNGWRLATAALPGGARQPGAAAIGPDGALWFLDHQAAFLDRYQPSGALSAYPIPAPARAMVAGPDGALWFTEPNAIGSLTTAGRLDIYPLPAGEADLQGIAVAQDGAVWFAEQGNTAIGRLDARGHYSEYQTGTFPAALRPRAVAVDHTGDVWFSTLGQPLMVGKLTPSGRFTFYPVGSSADPTSAAVALGPIAVGSDGMIDIAENPGSLLFALSPNSQGYAGFGDTVADNSPIPVGYANMTVGFDGGIWLTAPYANALATFTQSKTYTLQMLPGALPGIAPDGIASDPVARRIWFVGAGGVGYLTPGP